ncbi:Hsp70 family protein [Flavobacteriales bacterium]|nr:Hsp70 family protein [Flavobacteriales bacterium]
MSRIKYGIDLGTTNSAIAVIEKGESNIIKNQLNKDTTPSCVGFRKGRVSVGDRAYNQLNADKLAALKKGKGTESNTFVEFKRTMGTDTKYYSSDMNKDFSSEELSSEVIKFLKSLPQEDNFKSVVITIPAMFNDNQKAATQKAATLAGFTQVELLQEPIAAAMAYGIDENHKDGTIIMFDFGGGTFDVCLVDIEDGIMQVKDTGGDNWLGGKNLDQAIVDEIIIKYIKENYTIDNILNNEIQGAVFKESLKVVAEQIKINLSFSDSYDVISNIGDYPEDDNGDDIELDFTITSNEIKSVLTPIFQKSIDITNDLLSRNNLDGDSIVDLILVGGPTFSPILRGLIAKQIKEPNTKVDPMTVVARGAAVYATQFEIDASIQEEIKDKTKIQLELSYESQSVEDEEMLVIKLDKSKTEGDIPEKIFVSVKRSDGGWESDKAELSDAGDIIDLKLRSGKPNNFEILISDDGGSLDCEPNELTIIQGVKSGSATLAYNFGVELLGENGKANFYTIPGLEKNNTMPACGEKSGLKTQKDIRPGTDDNIKISIYQGLSGAEGTRASNQTWVSTVELTGNDIPKLLPKNSEVSLFLEIIRDGLYKLSIDIPYLNETIDKQFDVTKKQSAEDEKWFNQQFDVIDSEVKNFEQEYPDHDITTLDKVKLNISEIKKQYLSRKSDDDVKMQTRDNLRKQFMELDTIQNEGAWPSAESSLKDTFSKLEEKIQASNSSQLETALSKFKVQMEKVLLNKNVLKAKELEDEINALMFRVIEEEHGIELWIAILHNFNDDFDSQAWSDRSKARTIIDSGIKETALDPNKSRIRNYVGQLYALLPQAKKGPDDILGK